MISSRDQAESVDSNSALGFLSAGSHGHRMAIEVSMGFDRQCLRPLMAIIYMYCILFKYLYSDPQQTRTKEGAFGSVSSKKRDKFQEEIKT